MVQGKPHPKLAFEEVLHFLMSIARKYAIERATIVLYPTNPTSDEPNPIVHTLGKEGEVDEKGTDDNPLPVFSLPR